MVLGLAMLVLGIVLAAYADAIQQVGATSLVGVLNAVHTSARDLGMLAYRSGVLLAVTGAVVGIIGYVLPTAYSRDRDHES